tara:strand:+ start:4297 stop:5535 length:1239 start_codon:yes stop_codon:yes gene_type:complete
MKKTLLILFICFASFHSERQSKINIDLTKEQWIEDLNHLKTTIISKHLNPYHTISRDTLDAEYQLAMKRIKLGTSSESALALTAFAAKFGDGHTYAMPYKAFHDIPFYFRWFQDKLFVQDIDLKFKKYQGWEIIKFGDYTPTEIFKKVSIIIPGGESKGYMRNESQYVLRFIEVLQFLKIIKNNDDLSLVVKSKNNEIKNIKICAKKSCNKNSMTDTFERTPLRYQDFQKKLWYKKIGKKESIGYFNFIGYPSKKEVKNFGNELQKWIKKEDFKTLLIDFRMNGGGDGNKGKMILNKIKKTIKSKELTVYVAIGNMTFSAGMGNASDFKRGLNATFIGQPTGARPNGYQENNSFILPNSKISCSYSSEYYTYSDKDTHGIIPDILIEDTWEEFYSGQDLIIENIFNKQSNNN